MEKLNDFWKQNRLVIKALFIGVLTLLLLIPVVFTYSLVDDRQTRHDEAYKEISSKWAGTQTLTGPILVIPYQSVSRDANGKTVIETGQEYFLPDSLRIDGFIKPEKRRRGIYEAVLYRSNLRISGNFSSLFTSEMKTSVSKWLPEQAFLLLGLSDMRGIESQLAVDWNGERKEFNPGLPQNSPVQQGVYVPLTLNVSELDTGASRFSIQLQLKGSGELDIAPVGKISKVDLNSSWTEPSFTGSFLPDSHKISKNGFEAHWTIYNLNRNLPQQWTGGNYNLNASKFGVSLILPVNVYQKNIRCIKYAILIIALTFVVFFLLENSQNNPVHPLQYLLIGLALCVFYTLLLSLSEYLRFEYAYGIAAVSTTGLIGLYAKSLFKKKKRMPWLIATALLVLYGFIFTLVQSQDYSLLLGSIGLFIVLAVLMFYTRKLNIANTDRQTRMDDVTKQA